MITLIAQGSDATFLFMIVAGAIGVGIVIDRWKRRCRNPKCGKWAQEKKGSPCLSKSQTITTDDWVMENTQTVIREDDRLGPTPWGDSRRQVRESFHEKVKY